jgi:cytochrome b561
MPLRNTTTAYGGLNKALHRAIAGLFAAQLVSGPLMVRLGEGPVQDALFDWHKTPGLMALLIAVPRLLLRRFGRLPDWAPVLSETERRPIHRLEQLLYLAMFLMPLSGFVFVMAGGHGVRFVGVLALLGPIGRGEAPAAVAQVVHIARALLLSAALAGHLGLVQRHAPVLRDGLLRRMRPGSPG